MTAAPAVDRPPGAARRVLRLMIPLMLVLFISNLDATVVATAIPSIGRGLHDQHRRRRTELPGDGHHRRCRPAPAAVIFSAWFSTLVTGLREHIW
jgi:hypothetical protein